MSLRCVGNQLLQTAPSPLLAGASTASLSLWIRVNPGNNVAGADGVEIFGDAGGKLSATLSGTGSLRLRWSSIAGNSGGSSSCTLTLALGTSYHLAAVWQDGAQHYYLNGVQVMADTQAGSIGVLGDAAAHPFRIGSDSAGTDASLGDPTLWVGHALGAQEVIGLRDRSVQPSSIAPSSIALRWSLSGPDGVAARVGDPGLADASPSGLNLSTVVGSAPQYQASALTYLAPPPPLRAMLAPSGESFAIRPLDGSGNPYAYAKVLSIQSGNDEQTFSPSLATTGGSFPLSIDGQTTAPIAFQAHDPGRFALWHDIPVAAGIPHQISLTVDPDLNNRGDVLVEIIEGNLVLATATLDQYQALPGDFTLPNPGNGGVLDGTFRVVVPSYTPSGPSLSVRLSAPLGSDSRGKTIWIADALHVKNLASGAVVVHDDGDSAHFAATNFDQATAGGYYQYWNGSFHTFLFGGGAGSTYTIDPAAVQSALEALPSIGAGNVVASIVDGKVKVEAVNGLGAQALPGLTSTNPAMTFAHTSGGSVPTIAITPRGGPPGSPIPLRGLWIPQQNNLSWAIYPFDGGQTTRFLATDSVSVTIPAGWMTVAGPGGAATPLTPGTYAAENLVGGTMLQPFDPGPKTMGIGQNFLEESSYAESAVFSNYFARNGQNLTGPLRSVDLAHGHVLAWDANGDPTLLNLPTVRYPVIDPESHQDGVGGTGARVAPGGYYTVKFDGPWIPADLDGNNTAISEVPIFRRQTGTTDNVQVFDLRPNPSLQSAPSLGFNFQASGPADADGNYPCATKNVRIYPPDPADPTGMTPWLNPPTQFTEETLARMATARVIRNMQPQRTDDNSYADFDQIKPASWTDRSGQQYVQRAQVASVRQYTGTPLEKPNGVVFQVATVQPHGMFRGLPVNFEGCGTVMFSDPRFAPKLLSSGVPGAIWGGHVAAVIDDHTLAVHCFEAYVDSNGVENPYSGTAVDGVTITNVDMPANGAINGKIGTPWPLETSVDLINTLDIRTPGIPRRLWQNVSASATDACISAIFAYLAANLRPGIKACAELGNECWNSLYVTNSFMTAQTFQLFGLPGYHEAYAYYQGRLNRLAQAEFTAAGRGSDFVHLFCGFAGNASDGDSVLKFAANPLSAAGAPADAPYPCDEYAIAPYTANFSPPDAVAPNVTFARSAQMTAGMHLDVLELNVEDHGFSYSADNLAAMRTYYPAARLVAYEGGWEEFLVGLSLTNSYYFDNDDQPIHVLYPLQHQVHRHWRMHGITLRQLQQFQDDGFTLFTNFHYTGIGQWQGWSTYEWGRQVDGTGDPAENPDYLDTSALTDSPVKSQVGGAITAWNSLVGAAPSTLAAGTATAGPTTDTTANATATEATGATGTVSHQWYRSIVAGATGAAVSGQATLTLADSGLAAGTTYYYKLKYTDSTGSAYSNQVAVATTGGGTTLTAGTATAGSATDTTAKATATEATGATGAVAHQWYRSTISGQPDSPVAGQTTLTLADSGLMPGTTYYYRLKYTDASGSAYSNQVAVATTGGGTTSLPKPYVPVSTTRTARGWAGKPHRPIR